MCLDYSKMFLLILYRLQIQQILKNKNCQKILHECINRVLQNIKHIESDQGIKIVKTSKHCEVLELSILKICNYLCLNVLNIVLKHIEHFEMLEISSVLNKELMKEVKLALVDFMYRFKDRKYRYILENGDIYYAYYEVMDFMTKYKLKPSIKLQEEYKQAPLNNISFPDFETLHEEIEISEKVYSEMVKK